MMLTCTIPALVAAIAGLTTAAGPAAPHHLAPIPIQRVTIEDSFWSPTRTVWQAVTIPNCFTKFVNDRGGAINNFDRVRDGKVGAHAGPEWYDGLVANCNCRPCEVDVGWRRRSSMPAAAGDGNAIVVQADRTLHPYRRISPAPASRT